ncbi:flagellin [Actinoplanes sp. GCM10030250]|uniref:flagellin N-terminal helical domain-containing protein n=1 Tax=Actinoplanes sp. GCM10030250 TaxID=3273376 RepID=UPI00360751D2
MGLRINQNIAAQNAYRNLSVTDNQMSKSLEKLSSGFRINRAADDAAGLSISEGLRAQIGGLKTAVRNTQDGVSVAQTAEGALNEVTSILQRMRDLSVQTSNSGAMDVDAKDAANKEMSQLNAELDRIGETTAFGKSKLLDGSFGSNATKSGTALTAGATGAGTVGGALTDLVTANAADITLTINKVDGTDLTALATPAPITITVKAGTFTDKDSPQDVAKKLNAAISSQMKEQTNPNTGTKYAGNEVSFSASTASSGDVTFGASGVGDFSIDDGTGGALNSLMGAATVAASSATPAEAVAGGNTGRFQVGANANERISINIGAVNSNTLGTAALNLKTDPSSAITAIDSAIRNVSDSRAQLGAYQNRFEHTINNLNVAVENLSASESRIRDTDMAQEMVSFTRSQILTQAGTSMLSQANQSAQNVLSLLR